MITYLKNKLNEFSKFENLMIMIGIITSIPFLILCFYCNPASDDFWYNTKFLHQDYISKQISWYNEWSGRYTATLILTIREILSHNFLFYKLTSFSILSLLYLATYLLSKTLFDKLKTKDHLAITFYFTSLYLIQMPIVSQGFYWLAGSISYLFGNILTLFFFSSYIKYTKTKKNAHLILSIIVLVLIIGTNETSMIAISLIVFTIFAYNLYVTKQTNYYYLFLFIITIAFSIIAIKSPGNIIRSSIYPNINKHDFGYSILRSGFKSFITITKWIPIISIFTLMFINYINSKNLIRGSIFKVKHPLVIFCLIGMILFTGFFPSYFSLGIAPPLRTLNTTYFLTLAGLTFISIVIISTKKYNLNYSPFISLLLTIFSVGALFSSKNIKTAYYDLISGTAANYNKDLKERYKKIENCHIDTCIVPDLSYKPKSLFSSEAELTPNPKDWKNESYSLFFNRKQIIIKHNKKESQ